MDRGAAIELLEGLVSIPSVSEHEADAVAWLVARMAASGFDRAFADPAGNAVGEMGPDDAERTVVLLGHIDTVPGDIEVRTVDGPNGPRLYGRGTVDAKGPLACFVAATARLGSDFAREHGIRFVVVGAVE
ncbi:MAG: M20/M25/M40 family metallo-hydrolase, partial [Thermoanaerobaculia bacterium]|nr:M20/M25/M40 family metallo-hydrolase [Thermoanaerobaculia bacterium]